jgi:hypothetical protein
MRCNFIRLRGESARSGARLANETPLNPAIQRFSAGDCDAKEKTMKNQLMIWSLGSILLIAAAAQAQQATTPPPVPVPAPAATTVTSTTTTTSGGDTDVIGAEPTVGTMPTTGGAPLAMMLSGGLTAAGAFLLRRRLARCNS